MGASSGGGEERREGWVNVLPWLSQLTLPSLFPPPSSGGADLGDSEGLFAAEELEEEKYERDLEAA